MRHFKDTEVCQQIPQNQATWRVHEIRPLLIAVAMAWALLTVPVARAQGAKPTDYEVKAAYLYNFGRFVEWPVKITAANTGPFTICILGEDPFGQALDAALAGETIGNQRVAARRISNPQMSTDCQILFISSSEANRLNKIVEALDKSAVLTVSDIPQFSQHRGMIQFVSEGNRIRFEVNLTATQRAGLTLSSELLKVATAVRKNPQPGD